MLEKEIEELNKAIKHLETDILPSQCNGNISCYNEHMQLYKWLKELKSYKEIQIKNMKIVP
jgi:predicted translin family RNA/ssDNA-binding protein